MSLAHLVILPCPNGRAANGAWRYSLYLAPRLRETGSLGNYEIWRNWGQRVANLQFRVFVGNGQTATPVTITSPAVDPAVWAAVFGGNPQEWSQVTVEPFTFVDRTDTALFGYRTDELATKLQSIYGELALSPDSIDRGSVKATVDAAQTADLLTDGETWMGQIGNGQDPTQQEAEFHQALRQLSSHPDLLRRLGLVIDVEIMLPPAANPSEMQFRSNYPFLPASGPPVTNFDSRLQVPCRVQIDAATNYPEVRLPDYRTDRWVNFDLGKYVVAQGSSVEMINTLASLQREINDAEGEDTEIPMPAVGEAGITVSNVSVEDQILDQFAHQAQLEAELKSWLRWMPGQGPQPLPPAIYAEDVGAGIRWDAADVANGSFRSLHQRTAPTGYTFPRNAALAVLPPDSEGWSTLAISTDGTEEYTRQNDGQWSVPEGPQTVQNYVDLDTTKWRVDGDMMLWDGWSLSVRRPGRAIDGAGNPTTEDPNLPLPTDPAQVAVEYHAVPGTLERLRFEHTYRLRGRWVDLAGNSEPLSASQPSQSPPVLFGRTWPVASPTTVRRSSKPVPGVGDHTTTIVIKSELTQRDNTVKPTDRMLFPASVNQLRLERHGLPPIDGIDIADYQFLVDRDSRNLADQLLIDPLNGESVAGAAIIGDEVSQGPTRQAAEYLPDPAGDGVAFHDLPRGRAGRSVVMKTGNWPNPESVILELAAGNRVPRSRVADRKVTVTLPKGTIHECTTSSAIDRDWLDHFKYFEDVPNNKRRAVGNVIVAGQNPMYSPRQKITLVHAVRIPLDPPSLKPFTAVRPADEEVATVSGTVLLHIPTTDRIVIPCKWDGPSLNNDPSGLTIATVGAAILTDTALPLPEPAAADDRFDFADKPLDLRDTKRHTVTATAESFCRFSEYFTERVELTLTNGVQAELDNRGFDPVSVHVVEEASGASVPFAGNFTYDSTAGTITPDIDGLVGSLDVYVDYIPLPISRVSEEARTGKSVSFLIPASAPPPPPIVDKVLPAFSRNVRTTASRITINHDGRVVRAHLAIPWNESGEGEQLGVALASDGSLSQWGRDATVVAAGTRRGPTTGNFKKAISRNRAVDGQFDVAGHEVAYDSDRNLLTSDIQVNATFAYRPFVKLHLCRFQPEAVNDAHLSTVVATDVLRLGAQRTVVVSRSGNDRVSVRVTGPDNENEVTVRIEESDPTITDPAMSWQEAGTPVSLPRAGTRRSARFTGLVNLPNTANPRRIIIEDAEPVQRHGGAALVTEYEVAYREVVEIPSNW